MATPGPSGKSVSCNCCGTTVFVDPSGEVSVGTHLELARTFLVAGNLTASRTQLIKALEVDPNSRYVWFLHALTTALAGSLDEAGIYLTKAATTPQEAGGWLSSLLPSAPNPLAGKILDFFPSNGAWRDIVGSILDRLLTQVGGARLRNVVEEYARQGNIEKAVTVIEANVAAGQRKDAAYGYLSLAEKLGKGDPRTIRYIERAIQVAGIDIQFLLDDWKFRTGYSLEKLGWPPESFQPPNDEPEPKQKAWWKFS
jgi:tetratricopeptide (TPR) repeat protein